MGSSTTDIMSPSVKLEDPEDPKSSQVKCRCLDYCLVISLVLLTIAVGSLCILYVTCERPQLKSTIIAEIENHQEFLQGRSAQLVVDQRTLRNGILEWSHHAVTSTFVGEYIKRDKEELLIQKTGFYFLSSQMTLRCVDANNCNKDGAVSISILKNRESEPILKVNVHIDGDIDNFSTKTQPSSFSGSIRYLSSGDRISTEVWTSHEINDWHFDREHSVLSLFWISDSVRYHQE
ncbi:tumor necrosis factor ligand superfamily member 9 [Eleutherodactylus coqui]|uniref:tumor necrosis factor ligand superfamily member 9 n=1 Tax=Eleutherodactylus coqui TaxID=57060 RepID=UPI003462ABEC